MKLRHLMTVALGAMVLSCQGPAAVLAQEAVANAPLANREGVGVQPDVAAPAARALDEALRRLG